MQIREQDHNLCIFFHSKYLCEKFVQYLLMTKLNSYLIAHIESSKSAFRYAMLWILEIILCQLRNKASNLNAHLLKDNLTDDPHCLHCGYEFEGNVHYFLECPKYTQQRDFLS